MRAGLTHATSALVATGGSALLTAWSHMLQDITSELLQKATAESTSDNALSSSQYDFAVLKPVDAAMLQGCCLAQSAACMALLPHLQQQHDQQQQQQKLLQHMSVTVCQLRVVLAASKHGDLTGSAASSLGSVLDSVIFAQMRPAPSSSPGSDASQGEGQHAQHGTAIELGSSNADRAEQSGLSDSELKAAVAEITGAVAQAAKLPRAAAAKRGIALGLFALLGGVVAGGPAHAPGKASHGSFVDKPGWSSEAKAALQVSIHIHKCDHSMFMRTHMRMHKQADDHNFVQGSSHKSTDCWNLQDD